ncbi:MAG: DsbA family protein [Roseibium sp.]|uniref:DsbA family protein n=1 Tax=Roseibium sp. TaxID=1936156 RepID=UPI003297FAC8
MMIKTYALVAAMGLTALPAAAQEADFTVDNLREMLVQNPDIVVEAIQTYEANRQADATQAMNDRVVAQADALFSTDGIPYIGSDNPDVEIVVFSDYRCPYCANNEAAVAEILAEDDKVRFIQREMPILGQESVVTASYALAVFEMEGQEAYEAVHNRAFERAGRVNMNWVKEDAQAAGYDYDAVVEMMQSPTVVDAINANLDLAREMQITGTPFMAVNGVAVPGALKADGLRRLISEARSKG